MKKIITAFFLFCLSVSVKAQTYVTIPDANFVTYLQVNFPTCMSGNQMDITCTAIQTATTVDVYNLSISNLSGIQYFINLDILICSNNQLTNLPPLPNSITHLDCGLNNLTSLPTLPTSLTILACDYNQLTSLPTLPYSIHTLYCDHNQLTSLPSLPNLQYIFYCDHNQLTNIPTLPSTIRQLVCSHNQLTSLPYLPSSLKALECSYNNIMCFEPFPNTIYDDTVSVIGNPCNCLPNYIAAMTPATLAYPLCSTGNSNGCPAAEGILGYAYKDVNGNCVKDAGDILLTNIPIKLYDNSNTLLDQTITAVNGIYTFNKPAGSYTIILDTLGSPFKTQCIYPGADSSVTVLSNALVNDVNFPLTCKPGFDIGVQSSIITGHSFTPGFQSGIYLYAGDMNLWHNLNCSSGISGQVKIELTGPYTYNGPMPGALTPSISGNIYTYNIFDFGLVTLQDFFISVNTNTTATIGSSVCISVTVTPTSGDYNPGNNIIQRCYPVINSYDPNFKEVNPIDVLPGYTDWLTFTIHFQNTGTAPANTVKLLDTLDSMLDLETFQVIASSHLNTTHVNGNVLTVNYQNILLPDSTSDFQGSQGYVQYRIKPKSTWAAPYKIKNTAYIYFDYNAPIVTNTTYNSILTVTGVNHQSENLAAVYPNPTMGVFTIELNTKEKQQLQLFDLTGNVVLTQIIENGKTIIDANYLAAGMYNITIKGNNTVTNKKLAIVK